MTINKAQVASPLLLNTWRRHIHVTLATASLHQQSGETRWKQLLTCDFLIGMLIFKIILNELFQLAIFLSAKANEGTFHSTQAPENYFPPENVAVLGRT